MVHLPFIFLDHLLVLLELLSSSVRIFAEFTANGAFQKLPFHAHMEHLFSLAPGIVEAQHGTSSIAGMHQHASWCQGLVVLGKAMLDQQLADGICLLVNWHRTCLDGGWDIHKHPCLSGQWAAHVEIPLLFFWGGEWIVRIPPGSLTLPLKNYHPKRKAVFQSSFFRGYVKLRGCTISFFMRVEMADPFATLIVSCIEGKKSAKSLEIQIGVQGMFFGVH